MACFGKADWVRAGEINHNKVVVSLATIDGLADIPAFGHITGLKVGDKYRSSLVPRERRNMINEWYP